MTRREWLAAGTMALSSACGRRKGSGYPGYALVATAGENSLSVVDLTEFRLTRQIGLGAAPTAILTGGKAGSSYVLTPKTGSVHVLDGSFNRAGSRKLAQDLSALRLTGDGKRLLAVSAGGQELVAANAATLQPEQRKKLAGEPISLDVSNDGLAAVASAAGEVELFDLKNGKYSRQQITGPLAQVRFRKDGRLLLVASQGERTLSVLDVPSLQVMVELQLAMQPQNLCFNSDEGQLFVSGPGMDGVAIVFPYDTLEVEQTVLAGRDPGPMTCSADPAYLFVASASGSDVCILNIETRKLIGLVEVGQKPCYLAVTPDSQYALVLNRDSGDMAVIHIAEIQANLGDPDKVRNKTAASLFTMLPVGSQPVHAAIVPRAS